MALSNPNLALPNSVLKRSNAHYLHFCVDEFLAESHDAQLRVEFPSELLKARLGNSQTTSLDLLDGTAEVEEFLTRSPIWRRYRDTLRSSQWLKTVLQQFRKEIVARYPLYLQPILGKRTLNPSNLEVSVALSFSRRGFHLSPHSDDKYKVLTLIHYLPEQSGAETSGGTRFFVPRPNCSIAELRSFSEWSRGIRKYLPFFRFAPSTGISLKSRYNKDDIHDEDEQARFEYLFSVGDYVEYRANRILGFVKNNWTFHEVDLCDFPSDQFRRAALINVRLERRWWTRVAPGIDRVLSHIKRVIRSQS